MEKRLIVAIFLSLLVILSWSALTTKLYHPVNKEVTEKPSSYVSETLTPALDSPKETEKSTFAYSTDKLEIVFVEPEAAIQDVIFKAQQDYKFTLGNGFFLKDSTLSFKKEKTTADEIVFVHSDDNKKIVKHFIFSEPYSISLHITLQNLSNADMMLNLPLVLGTLDFTSANPSARFQDFIISTKEKTLHLNTRKPMNFQEAKFIGLRDRYFCAIIEPVTSLAPAAYIQPITSQRIETGLNLSLPPNRETKLSFRIYLGPQELTTINNVKPAWSSVIHYGAFDVIAQILLKLITYIYSILHNWGWSIVIISLLIYILLFPLSAKQMRSMKEMQALQPKIEELRRTHKDNPQRMNKEIMELYKEHKVNPFGGCFPVLLQIPIFFALYQVLMRAVFLKGAKFLWIKDLSEPDRLFTLPFNLPVISNELNLLPILMVLGMFIQQKLSAKVTTTNSEQQKLMMVIFPAMFGLFFYRMSSGLVLYWFTNSALMLLYQLRVSRAK
ncbi:MAG: membrane protein insertase YidC [Candidatus Omnitrophota bacterium]